MSGDHKFLTHIESPHSIITAIDLAARFPEVLGNSQSRYQSDISLFKQLANEASSTSDLLARIRTSEFNATQRMTLLKIFRRCVSPIIDTEMAKKIRVPTSTLVDNYGDTFKPIETIRDQFNAFTPLEEAALAALVGEYDTRGQLGYKLTDRFFSWFENTFHGGFTIEGPRGAGRDIELSSIFQNFDGDYPCDFVIKDTSGHVCAVGFARYDSTRGGAQSDDRTGGNSDKVAKAIAFCQEFGHQFRLIFLADGPGLAHRDTWYEACKLDGAWNGAVRVTTLKTAPERVTSEWLLGHS
ncbi:hypothetical protein [Pseudomonas guariconensis]|uniref:hypothetical protein n=1 Tax=Pseudomonas guariconensis TaxID=1288410 RepID=UPI0018AB5692|nr:hypothetical protein [Pseudomonas guariconensis]MBF8755486.1 hypothetical protein [Pseudomonas guariconensis]